MSDEQINIAIAEECGWKQVDGEECFFDNGTEQVYIEYIPDYCNDLNAMHEAEKSLAGDIRNHYIDFLGEAYSDSWEFARQWMSSSPKAATARQRAEAFLRTIGKWEETK